MLNRSCYFLSCFGYIVLFFCIFFVVYGFFLDFRIRKRVSGAVWHLPAVMYSRVINLEPGMHYSCKDMVNLLNSLQYRQVDKIIQPGEFIVNEDNIELLRRSFEYPGGKEEAVYARMLFCSDKLIKIHNCFTNRDFGFFRLNPCLIAIVDNYCSHKQRLFMPRSGFPDALVDVLLAVEDRCFYRHDGIKLSSIFRAFLVDILSNSFIQGGSTLTQQLVRNLFLGHDRSLWRKFNEAYMALILDYRYSKDRILELYLNEVYLGQIGDYQVRGFPLASLYYFNCPMDELTLDQYAMLVGMVKGASLYNPWRNPALSLQRRNIVLKSLKDMNLINKELYEVLISTSLGVRSKINSLSYHPAFVQMVNMELEKKCGKQIKNISGIKIFTTLDPVSQMSAEKAVEIGVSFLRDKYNIKNLEGAMVVVDKFNGEIRAIVGGANPHFPGFNRALYARRSVGSLIKPAIYLTALSMPNKYRLNTWIADEPITIQQDNGDVWSPKNYDKQYRKKVMLIDALVKSLNVPTVHLGLLVGIDKINETLKNLGVPKFLLHSMPSILLGSINLTPIEVAQQFQAIANNGNYISLFSVCSVLSDDGTVIYHNLPHAMDHIIPPQSSYLVLYAMQQVVSRGTALSLGEKFPLYNLAAKTGTTNNFRDSWFVGIDGKEVSVVWLGLDNNGSTNLTGSSGSLNIYCRYLEYHTPLALRLVKPEGIVNVYIDYMGDFTIDNKFNNLRSLPIWTDDPELLYKFSF